MRSNTPSDRSPLAAFRSPWRTTLFVSLTLAAVSACKKQEALELPPPIVTVTQAVEKQVQDWDEYTGRLAPMGTVDVRPRVSGYITEVKFVDGDLVKKGQPLFIIDPRPYQADYEKLKAELDKADAALKLASSDYDRARQLRDKGVTAAGDFDQRAATFQQATGAFQSARAALEAAKLNLEFCTVTAPIDGRAGLANVTVGNLVSADGKDPLTRKEAIVAGAASLSALAMAAQSGRAEAEPNPEVTKIRALLKAHDEAMTNHDLSGVMKCLTENAAIMGTGPGEFWVGPEEIKTAYEHFFETFDKGAQDFQYQFRIGGVGTDMGWLMASGNVTAKKNGKESTFPMNISLTVAKKSDEWRIVAMHFSTLTGDTGAQEKKTS